MNGTTIGTGGATRRQHRILIAYASNHGQVARIVHRLAGDLRTNGAREVVTADLAHDKTVPAPGGFDGAIVAASVHAGQYQHAVVQWVRAHRDELAGRPTVFVSVSLTAAEEDPAKREPLAGITDAFVETTGWHPDRIEQVAGALPYRRYGWLTRWLMWGLMKMTGKPTDTGRDFEYTDWPQVDTVAREFAATIP